MFHKKNDKIDFNDSIWWFRFSCEILVYDSLFLFPFSSFFFFFFFFSFFKFLRPLILAWFEQLIILILIQYPWIYGDDFDSKEIPSVDKTRDWAHSRPLSWYSLIHQGFNSCLYKSNIVSPPCFFYFHCCMLLPPTVLLLVSLSAMMMKAMPCCNSKKAFQGTWMIAMILLLILRLNLGNWKGWTKIAACGMVLSATRTQVMWLASTSEAAVSMVLWPPTTASLVLFIFKGLILLLTTLASPASRQNWANFLGWHISTYPIHLFWPNSTTIFRTFQVNIPWSVI